MYKSFLKTTFDILISLIAILLLSPIFLIVFISLSITNEGKPFFLQNRPGKNGKIFKIIKFKTMTDKTDIEGKLLSDEFRLTKMGKFVRKTSLDELPQLINVIKGDMSLVGPRPLLPEYLGLYNDFQNRRNEVKPGITGWAQVNGRNNLNWEKKFTLDVWYVDHCSFFTDCKIILMTVKKILIAEGISQAGQATSEEFKGNFQ